jgi:adenylylsulfate kinase-like enzyme
MLAQIQLQGPSEQFQQHLEARLGDGRVVPALAKLISDKGICVIVSKTLPYKKERKSAGS